MDTITLIEHLVQIASTIWVLLAGGRTVFDVVQKLRKPTNPLKVRPRFLMSLAIALALFLSFSALLGWRIPPIPLPGGTPPQAGLLYQADWSKGIDGWSSTSSVWKALSSGTLAGNQPQNEYAVIIAPYHPPTANYAVEARIQALGDDVNRKDFGIITRSNASGSLGDRCMMDYYLTASASIENMENPVDKEVNLSVTDWHTYRIEVQDNHIRFLIDGQAILEGVDNTYLSAGQVGLIDEGGQVQVRDFKVFAL